MLKSLKKVWSVIGVWREKILGGMKWSEKAPSILDDWLNKWVFQWHSSTRIPAASGQLCDQHL